MAVPLVNGDVNAAHQSAFIEHVLNYPLISDGITTFVQRTLAVPVRPWIAKLYGYISPYVQRADSLGDKTLDRIDERFPVVKKPTNKLYNDTRRLILLPYNKSVVGRDHVFQVYRSKITEAEQQGLVPQGKAAVSTALAVSNETLSWLKSVIRQKEVARATQSRKKMNVPLSEASQ
ncbi:perilipin-like protein, Mpl1 [Purpureocillium lilacinum]|uniref:Perilipin-like protein, Mpl1 n=1 Tax=Purpureocillium lilacinum TaxID=33203 RepID=A0A179EZH9_PURLI|nr:perilipin-like protein, Mpl1 [Purpureocillium lilacinum]OAQ58562.1 perilipin-like protein, Mpl1 [Purpureocillium lilacinum]